MLRRTVFHACSSLSHPPPPPTPAEVPDDTLTAPTRSSARLAPGPYRRVGNLLVVEVKKQLWQQGWELARDLRYLGFEYGRQVTVHPDVPEVRERLFHVRHLVTIDMMDLDEVKAALHIPPHIHFSDLLAQYPDNWGEVPVGRGCYVAARKRFCQYRKERLRDIVHRDSIEKRMVKLQKQLAREESEKGQAQHGG